MSQNPQAMQLRFLQTIAEVATEQNSTLVMPIPVELLSLFGRPAGNDLGNGRPGPPPGVAPPPSASDRPAGPEEGPPPEQGNGRPG
jgi:hypothetical protein